MNNSNQVELIKRDEIPSMRTVVVDGVEHWLGHVKDFTKSPSLVNFLPKDNRISMAWVRLEEGEQLDEHIHPVESMILICEGSAKTLGDVKDKMEAGDILIVPPKKDHGFIGGSPNGFWGLSIQFDSRGLYEQIEDPWATFSNYKQEYDAGNLSAAEYLAKSNDEYMERFDKHRLFALVNKGLLKSERKKARFLDCFQVWSNYFQKMVISRVLSTRSTEHGALAWDHFIEELGHNKDISSARDHKSDVFDPMLEAASSWFANIITTLNDMEKLVLVHLVVEASATYFYKHIEPAMQDTSSSKHFTEHSIDDHEHVKMGYDLLSKAEIKDIAPLLEIQEKGWSMLGLVMARIADLVVHYPEASLEAEPEQSISNERIEEAVV